MKWLVRLFIGLFILSGCQTKEELTLNDIYKDEQKVVEVELGDKISLEAKDYLSEDSSQEMLEKVKVSVHQEVNHQIAKETIDMKEKLEVGEYAIILSYGEKEIQTAKVHLKVQDTMAPKFVDFKKQLIFNYGEKLNLHEKFKAEDLSDVTIKVEGKVENKKPGKYLIQVTAIDEYGNEVSQKCEVIIKEKPQLPDNNGINQGNGNASSNNINNKVKSHYDYKKARKAFDLLNQARINQGQVQLIWAHDFEGIANKRAAELVSEYANNNVHAGFSEAVSGYMCSFGENAGWTYGNNQPKVMVDGWLSSPGHYENIMSDMFSSMVLSCYYDAETNQYYWITVFVGECFYENTTE